nr:thioredoxin domain-containing protein [Pyrinomonadaceae bacterium]
MQSPKKHTNKLINETSPYLLQHAHNPVNWFGWCDEAFEKAQREDKPILVSIGYSACHWCHVMERESFENEEIAAILNENFLSIKVDLEERPDIDQIYMTFVQMTNGNGGYPLNVFIT